MNKQIFNFLQWFFARPLYAVPESEVRDAAAKLAERWGGSDAEQNSSDSEDTSEREEGSDDGTEESLDRDQDSDEEGEDGEAADEGEEEDDLGDGESDEDEGSDSADDEADSDDDEESDEDDDGSPSSEWEDLGEVLEAANVDMRALPVTIKSNGEDVTVSLHEALQGYQRSVDYDRRRAELEERTTAFKTEREKFETEFESSVGIAKALGDSLQEALETDRKAVVEAYEAVDWDKLKSEDPARYSIVREEYREAVASIDARSEEIKAKTSEKLKELAEERGKHSRERLQAGLIELMKTPGVGWDTEEKLASGVESVVTYLKTTYKATERDIRGMVDHRLIDLTRKAMLYDQMTAEGEKTIKSVKEGGKKRRKGKRILRPGKADRTSGNARRQSRQAEESRNRLKKSGSEKDAVKAISQRWSERE